MQTVMLSSPPSTPSRPSRMHHHLPLSFGHLPVNSSPLASSEAEADNEGSSPVSSPGVPAHVRRRSQYKSHESRSLSSPTSARQQPRRRVSLGGSLFQPAFAEGSSGATPTEEETRKAVLRERFKARCLERAQRDRERKIKGRRNVLSEASNEADDEIMDDDEADEELINDELFRRLISSSRRKERHSYSLSYHLDVGSSFDPTLEDVDEWEQEAYDEIPANLEEEELAAYAEEYELHLEDLCPADFFTHSDVEGDPLPEEDMDEATLSRDKMKGRAVELAWDGDVDMAM